MLIEQNALPLISIIVPIYKVEPFLRQCVESIMKQTYKNLEIILVDDGSPDDCGRLCDEFSRIDKRIIVIHKENGGLSDARSTGLDVAKGDFIGFVDSDDWVAHDMFEYLYIGITETDSDISTCGIYEVYDNEIFCQSKNSDEIFSREKAMRELLIDEKVRNFLWDKLYRRNVFTNVRHPIGFVYEDIGIMYQVFENTKKIAVKTEPKYYYRRHTLGVSTGGGISTLVDRIWLVRQRHFFIRQHYPSLLPLSLTEYIRSLDYLISKTLNTNEVIDAKLFRRIKEEVLVLFYENKPLIYRKIGMMRRIQYLFYFYILIRSNFALNVSRILFKFYKRIIRRKKEK